MIIDNKEVLKLVKGYLWSEETEDGYLRFYRLTPYQLQRAEKNGIDYRQFAASGMKMDLVGDIKEISFDAKLFPGSYNTFFGIDCLQDGRIKFQHFENENTCERHIVFKPTRPCRVTVLFPNMNEMWIKNVKIEGTYELHKDDYKFLFLGDSITQGFDCYHPANTYPNRLAVWFNAEIINQGIGGNRYYADDLDDELPNLYDPDVIFAANGCNDWRTGQDIRKQATEYLTKLKKLYPDKKIFVITPIWCGLPQVEEAPLQYSVLEADKIVEEIAKSLGMFVIDGDKAVPHDPALYSKDCVHPCDEGFYFEADSVRNALKEKMPELFENGNGYAKLVRKVMKLKEMKGKA